MNTLCYDIFAQTTTKGVFTVDSITQIKTNIESFSKLCFKFIKYIELLLALRHIPDTISRSLNDIDFLFHLQQASFHIDAITAYFDVNVIPALRKESSSLKKNHDHMQPYADFSVHQAPLFATELPDHDDVKQLSFNEIAKRHLQETGRPLKPIKRKTGKLISYKGNCSCCGAPNDFLYLNDGRKQYRCKACRSTFSVDVVPKEKIGIYCPHCKSSLQPHHKRGGYVVYRCDNKKCSFFLENKKLVASGQGEHLKTSSGSYLLHYHYRAFNFSMDDIRALEERNDYEDCVKYKARLSRVHFPMQVFGTVMCYYVNYGLSSRKTALIMKEMYGLDISHQTVVNYAAIAAALIKPMVDFYPYDLSSTLCGDETYIKVRGRNKYVFFWSDTTSRIITSYKIYDQRDTKAAVASIYDSLMHYREIPDDLTCITDGNPIYNAAQLFFDINGISFDLHQVIGVKNSDEESKKYRPHKQKEERLNRTYKHNYYGTNGYDSLDGANRYMILYVAFYNFLRKHSSLGYRTPVDDGLFEDDMLMPDRWLKLIQLSAHYQLQF